MIISLILFFAASLLFSFSVKSQEIDSDTIEKSQTMWKDLKTDGGLVLGGVKHAFKQPLQWKKDDWLTFGAVATGTVILFISDDQTSEYFIDQNERAPHVLKEVGWYYGGPQNFFMMSAGIYGYGLIAKNEKFRHTGVLIISSAVTTGLIQTLTKNGVGRARPSQNIGSNKFKSFSKESGYHSFPSGHSILSFTASHAIAKQFDNIWIKGGIYTVGLIAPISRLWIGAHWLSDVALSMAISIFVVDGIDNFLQNQKNSTEKPKISWQIKAGVNTVGLVGTF